MEPLELISTAPKRRRAVLPVAENAPIASVLVDTGVVHLDRPFDYLVPAKWEEVALPGTLVRVPFSGRLCDGIVLERIEASNHQSLKPISSVVSAFPILSQELLRLIDRCCDFYVGTFWDLFRSAVPPRHAKGEKEALAFVGNAPTVPKEISVPMRVESFLGAVKAQKHPRAILLNEQGEKYEEALLNSLSEMIRRGMKVLYILPDQRDVERVDHNLSLRGIGALLLHSGLSPQIRYRNYILSERSDHRLIIGTRGALFARGIYDVIVLSDEEDHSYQEPRTPGWSAAEVANIRSEDCALLLSLPSVPLARVPAIKSKALHLLNVDIPRPRVYTDASGIRIPTAAWNVMRKALKSGPVLISVARKGHTPGLLCQSCGNRALCICGGPLVLLSSHAVASCSLCERANADWKCSECQEKRLRPLGIGSERTVEELGKAFPGIPVQSSTAEKRIESVGIDPRIVVATSGCEPTSSDGYQAVILLDGEYLASRAELDAVQDLRRRWKFVISLLSLNGEVFSSLPDAHPIVKSILLPNSLEFYERELSEREDLGLPPAVAAAVMSPAPAKPIPGEIRALGSTERTVLTCSWEKVSTLRDFLRSERDDASLARRKLSYRFAPHRLEEGVQ